MLCRCEHSIGDNFVQSRRFQQFFFFKLKFHKAQWFARPVGQQSHLHGYSYYCRSDCHAGRDEAQEVNVAVSLAYIH